jgi:hypothetical protein
MYRISDNRCVGSPYGNALLFDTLCRNDSKKHIVIATTMWKRTRENVVMGREEGLGKKRWREMLLNGSRIMRFHDSFTSAWDIIDNVLQSRTSPAAPPVSQTDIDSVRPKMTLDERQACIDQLKRVKSAYVPVSKCRLSGDIFFVIGIDIVLLHALTALRQRKLSWKITGKHTSQRHRRLSLFVKCLIIDIP